MINVKITIDGEDVLFNFDGEVLVKKLPVTMGDSYISYKVALRYKEAIRDWLYKHRGQFGIKERRFEKVLFRIAG